MYIDRRKTHQKASQLHTDSEQHLNYTLTQITYPKTSFMVVTIQNVTSVVPCCLPRFKNCFIFRLYNQVLPTLCKQTLIRMSCRVADIQSNINVTRKMQRPSSYNSITVNLVLPFIVFFL